LRRLENEETSNLGGSFGDMLRCSSWYQVNGNVDVKKLNKQNFRSLLQTKTKNFFDKRMHEI